MSEQELRDFLNELRKKNGSEEDFEGMSGQELADQNKSRKETLV